MTWVSHMLSWLCSCMMESRVYFGDRRWIQTQWSDAIFVILSIICIISLILNLYIFMPKLEVYYCMQSDMECCEILLDSLVEAWELAFPKQLWKDFSVNFYVIIALHVHIKNQVCDRISDHRLCGRIAHHCAGHLSFFALEQYSAGF
jgi:hypothetical protein